MEKTSPYICMYEMAGRGFYYMQKKQIEWRGINNNNDGAIVYTELETLRGTPLHQNGSLLVVTSGSLHAASASSNRIESFDL